ncbi:MAG: bifunctional 2',3'-cyclic-nucleotide 2'-phosphodiesterase/3'-nucleotidase [Roseovarius confluentis]|jgi:2',3'-cyclic-nucleotide 2'-phosphodiesterase/3'-nucleotidase
MNNTAPDHTWPHAPASADRPIPDNHIWLRVLETTDVHAHLAPYDYHRDAEVQGHGLARTATLIARARAEAANSLLFDNGDFLQGSALSDIGTGPDSGWSGPHPVIAAMNTLGYDAVGLGNHEFNFGLDWLDRALSEATFPVLCANVLHAGPAATPLHPPSVILPTVLRDNRGKEHTLHIGVLGLLPPQITTWDHQHLAGRVTTRGIVETAVTEVPHLREAGADIVIVLAHTGIGPAASASDSADPALEHAALALATVPGIDALLTGHSHQVFPETTAPGPPAPGVDHHAGTLAGVPAVMAGFRGSHLGVLDLCLAQDAATAAWSVQDFHCRVQPVAPADGTGPATADPDLSAVTRPAHLATLQVTSQTVGHTAHPIHSYFARVRPCNALHPVLDAKAAALSAALGDTEDTDLPVLAATPCYKSGGHGGPGDFIDIPAGPLTLGHMAELYPFPNTLIGLRLTGAQIADWLERAASCFHQILPGHGTTPQPLWNPAFASHAFDTISGLSYRIDLSQPPRYDPQGQLIDSGARRIRDLSRNGTPLSHDALFCVATNNFRAYGGGPYPRATAQAVVHQSARTVRDHLTAFLRDTGTDSTLPVAGGWHLDGPRDATVLLETGPGARNHPEDLATLGARDLGVDATGFLRLAIPLVRLADLANPPQKA